MPVPDFQTIMLPFMRLLANGQEWKMRDYLQHIHHPVSDLVEVLKQLNNLLLKLEITRVDLRACTIFRGELMFPNHDWVWVEIEPIHSA